MKNKDLQLHTLIQGYWLSCQAEGKSPKTIEWYVTFLLRFVQFLEMEGLPTLVTQIDRSHLRSFICHLIHREHGAGFYRLLEHVMPDWRERKHRLELGAV